MEKDYGQIALCLKALADETRFKIFIMLADGELCACKILEEFNITQPTLSYHMKILCDRGLVNSRKDGIWMRYSINKDNLEMIRMVFDDISLGIERNLNHDDECKEMCTC